MIQCLEVTVPSLILKFRLGYHPHLQYSDAVLITSIIQRAKWLTSTWQMTIVNKSTSANVQTKGDILFSFREVRNYKTSMLSLYCIKGLIMWNQVAKHCFSVCLCYDFSGQSVSEFSLQTSSCPIPSSLKCQKHLSTILQWFK